MGRESRSWFHAMGFLDHVRHARFVYCGSELSGG
jgi:hypothetical protein